MSKKYSTFFGASLIVLAVFFWSENNFAPVFQSCINQNPYSQRTNDSEQKDRIVFRFITAEAICTLNLVDRHSGFFAAIAAFIVAWFTFTLKQSTDKLWKAGERQLKSMRQSTFVNITSARAARKSADVAEAALTVAERPYLVPKEPKMKLWRYGQPGMPPSNPPEYVGTIEYGFFNMGRTVAFFKEVTVRLIFVEALPDTPDYKAAVESPNDTNPRVLVGHYPIGHDKPYDCPTYGIGIKKKISASTFNDIQSEKLKCFFFGYIRYADVFDYLHTEGFCFRYTQIGIDQTVSQCAIVAGKNYNYSRREKIPPEGFETLPPRGAELTAEDIERLSAQMRAERTRPT